MAYFYVVLSGGGNDSKTYTAFCRSLVELIVCFYDIRIKKTKIGCINEFLKLLFPLFTKVIRIKLMLNSHKDKEKSIYLYSFGMTMLINRV